MAQRATSRALIKYAYDVTWLTHRVRRIHISSQITVMAKHGSGGKTCTAGAPGQISCTNNSCSPGISMHIFPKNEKVTRKTARAPDQKTGPGKTYVSHRKSTREERTKRSQSKEIECGKCPIQSLFSIFTTSLLCLSLVVSVVVFEKNKDQK